MQSLRAPQCALFILTPPATALLMRLPSFRAQPAQSCTRIGPLSQRKLSPYAPAIWITRFTTVIESIPDHLHATAYTAILGLSSWTPPSDAAVGITRLVSSQRKPLGTRSDFHHFEIVFDGAAVGASPVDRHILPTRPRRYAFFRATYSLVINEAADHTHVFFKLSAGHGTSPNSTMSPFSHAYPPGKRRKCYNPLAVWQRWGRTE